MTINGKCLTLSDFRQYCKTYDFGKIKPDSLVVHHTWSPKKNEWKGEKSIMGLKNYYEGKKWNAGPHLFVAEDGIWLFTEMKDIGIHASSLNSYRDKLGRLKGYSIGIEVVGDYDLERWTGETLKNTMGVIKILMGVLNIPTEKVYFHRDVPEAKKSCPGYAITKDWLFAELAKRDMDGNILKPQVTVSSWAQEGWDWAHELSLDNSILPSQVVTAEWVFAILKKLNN